MSDAAANAFPTTRYITRDQNILRGEPIVVGSSTPVRTIVEMWRSGMPAEEIIEALPHLTLAQVFDALSFYQDNMAEVNRYIDQNRISEHMVGRVVRLAMPEMA